MKPLFRLLMLLIFAVPNSITAQDAANACNLNYKISVKQDIKATNDYVAIMDWDFTTALKTTKSITIEVTPINDCYKKEEATDFKKSIFYTITQSNVKAFKQLALLDLNSKCFRWRVKLITATCEKNTDWTYYNFVQ